MKKGGSSPSDSKKIHLGIKLGIRVESPRYTRNPRKQLRIFDVCTRKRIDQQSHRLGVETAVWYSGGIPCQALENPPFLRSQVSRQLLPGHDPRSPLGQAACHGVCNVADGLSVDCVLIQVWNGESNLFEEMIE